MERAFGIDLSGVRTHPNSLADNADGELNVKACTVGRDIYFGEGQCCPDTSGGLFRSTFLNQQEGERTHMQPDVGHNVGQARVYDDALRGIQAKLTVSRPGDRFEQEADRVAARVVRQRIPVEGAYENAEIQSKRSQHRAKDERANQTSNQKGAEPETQILKSHFESGSKFGKPLDTGIKEEMSRKIGFDFGNVRVHTDDPAVYLNKGLNAKAFTHGSDIFFNESEYNPNSLVGKKLLAHELTHVVQQSRMTDGRTQREMIQCTSIGQILDNFFSQFSSEILWVMDENDDYTRIVRMWQPVINAVDQAKANLEANCADWSANRMTDSSWTPGKTDPPVTDPNADDIWVASPPGTDPITCAFTFGRYRIKGDQSTALHRCAIGSFGVYVTADSIDCAAKTAQLNIWMYNAMDQDSFGPFTIFFPSSGMGRQYMWWNWSESHSWGSSGSSGGGSGGGSNGW